MTGPEMQDAMLEMLRRLTKLAMAVNKQTEDLAALRGQQVAPRPKSTRRTGNVVYLSGVMPSSVKRGGDPGPNAA